jgi:hypothetical protein
MDGMVADTKLQANDRGHTSASPDLPAEAIGFGAPLQKIGQTRQLFGGEAAGSTEVPTRPQGFGAALSGARHPPADGPFADAQGGGDLALGPALLLELPGLTTSYCLSIVGCGVHAWQSIIICPETLPFNVLVSKSLAFSLLLNLTQVATY